MKHVLMAILMMAFSMSFQAQIEDYNFENYRQASTTFRALQINPTFGGDFSENELFFDGRQITRFALTLPLSFTSQINADHKQSFSNFSSRTNWSGNNRSGENDFTSQQGNFLQRFTADQLVDYYRDYNRTFMGYQWAAQASYGQESLIVENDLISTDVDQEVYRPSAWASAAFRLGWGRLENITNAWHSYRILNRLHFTGLTDKLATTEEINALGQFLDDIKTYRIFDNRLRNIALLRYIDDYLVNDLGIEGGNMKYFTELNDMYRFGITANRIQGQKITLKPGLGAFYQSNRTLNRIDDSEVTFSQLEYGPGLDITYLKAVPIQRDFQLNWESGIYGEYRFSESGFDSTVESQTYALLARTQILWAFYPTTRTEWTWQTGAYLSGGATRLQDEFNDFDWSLSIQSRWSWRYFLNPYTQFNVNAFVGYLSDFGFPRPVLFNNVGFISQGSEGFQGGLSLGMSHVFF